MDKQALKDSIKKTLLETSVYLVLGSIYVGAVGYFIPNRVYSTLFLVISLMCFFVMRVEMIMNGEYAVDAFEGYECPYHETCEYRLYH